MNTYVTVSEGATPVPLAGGFVLGDIWVDRWARGRVSRWDGTDWVAVQPPADIDDGLGRPGLRDLLLEVAAAAFLALVVLTPVVSLAMIVWYAVPKEAGQTIGILGAIVLIVATAIGWRR